MAVEGTLDTFKIAGQGFAKTQQELLELVSDAGRGGSTNVKTFDSDQEDETQRRKREELRNNALTATVRLINHVNEIMSNGFSFSYSDILNSSQDYAAGMRSGSNVSNFFANQARNHVAYGPDGQPLTRAQIDAQDNAAGICSIRSTEDEALAMEDLAAQDAAKAAAAEDIAARLAAGENIPMDQLPPDMQLKIVQDKVAEELAAGKTIDITQIDPQFRDQVVDQIISSEWDQTNREVLQQLGITEQQWKDGYLMQDGNQALADRYTQLHDEAEAQRRLEIYKDAGLTPPAPDATPATAADLGTDRTGMPAAGTGIGTSGLTTNSFNLAGGLLPPAPGSAPPAPAPSQTQVFTATLSQ